MTDTTGQFRLARHQSDQSLMMDNLDGLALFYEAGTGKTMCALDWIYRAVNSGRAHNVLVIAPQSVCPMWERAIDGMLRFTGYSEEGVQNVRGAVIIRSFGRLYRREVVRASNGAERHLHVLRDDIDRHWDAVIIDESHCIGSHSSVQTKVCLKLRDRADKRVIMTGTPVSGGGGKHDWQKLYTQLLFLDADAWDGIRTWTKWSARYVTEVDYYNKPCGYDDAQLEQKMREYGMVARLTDCYDMPGQTDTDIIVDMEKEQNQAYNRLAKWDASLPDGTEIDLQTGGSRWIKLYEITSGFVKRTSDDPRPYSMPTARLGQLEDLVTSTDDKVVVFCQFRESVVRVADMLSKHGRTIRMDGTSNGPVWKEFQDGDARYIVCQYQSGGVGIDLYASHTMVFYEPTMSALLLEQARARIRRKGQNDHQLYYYITTQDGQDRRISDTVRNGMDVTIAMMDNWDKEDKQ